MFFNSLKDCYNIDDLRWVAKKKLPLAMFGYLDGYAEDGVTGKRNREIFCQYEFITRALVDVEIVDTSTTVLGQTIDFPIICAPTALSRLFHHDGEVAVAKAADKADTIYTLSTLSSFSLEEVGSVARKKWLQLYMYRDKSLVEDLIERAIANGYQALCLTTDASIGGNREQDLRNGFTVPPKPSTKTILEASLHPYWCWNYVTKPTINIANFDESKLIGADGASTLLEYVGKQLTPSITWKDVEWLRAKFPGKLLIKGILSPNDVKQACSLGVDGLVISNHGGRQLDHTVTPFDMLPEIISATEGKADIIIDSGIRRGTDVLKAIALGAKACMVGRPYLYGLSAGGEAGVSKALEILRSEIYRNMQLLGCQSISALDAGYLRKVHKPNTSS